MKRFSVVAVTLVAACSSTGSAYRTKPVPSRSRVQSWAHAWCNIAPGATVADLEKAMGQPTSRFRTTGELQQESWAAYEWQFNAFLGANGRVHQLDISTIQLSNSEKAALTCDETRVEP